MKRILTAAGLAVIAVSTALAQVERPKFNLESIQQKAREVSDAEFKKMDKNNDGQISKDEYMEAMRKPCVNTKPRSNRLTRTATTIFLNRNMKTL